MSAIQQVIEDLANGVIEPGVCEAGELRELQVYDAVAELRGVIPLPPWFGKAIYDDVNNVLYWDSRTADVGPDEALFVVEAAGLSVIPFPEYGGVFLSTKTISDISPLIDDTAYRLAVSYMMAETIVAIAKNDRAKAFALLNGEPVQ